MSTKIYNGYLLDIPYKIDELTDSLQKIRNELLSAGLLDVKREILKKLIYAHDLKQHVGPEKMVEKIKSKLNITDKQEMLLDISPLLFFTHVYTEKYKMASIQTTRNLEYDFDCDLQIIPIKGKILCLLYAEREKYTEVFESLEFVKEFHYQNSTDKPKSISDEEWDLRRDLWSDVFSTGYANDKGFSLSCFNPNKISDIFNLGKLLENLTDDDFPSKQERILSVVTEWQDEMLKDCKTVSDVINITRSEAYKEKQQEIIDKYIDVFDNINLLNAKDFLK